MTHVESRGLRYDEFSFIRLCRKTIRFSRITPILKFYFHRCGHVTQLNGGRYPEVTHDIHSTTVLYFMGLVLDLLVTSWNGYDHKQL